MTAVVLLGPPGAGKGTVAEVFAEKGFSHISTGEMLREQIRLGTAVGKEAQVRLDQGRFVSDELVLGMIQSLIETADTHQNFLFDGFPRTLLQAEKFEDILHSSEFKLTGVILLECPVEQLIKRLSGRRTCQKCGTVYHVSYNPSSVEGVCDLDGCELKIRPDDSVKTVERRLEIYAEQTAPLIGFYREKGLIQPVDASQSIEEVCRSVAEHLG